jgi:hypothetical protein
MKANGPTGQRETHGKSLVGQKIIDTQAHQPSPIKPVDFNVFPESLSKSISGMGILTQSQNPEEFFRTLPQEPNIQYIASLLRSLDPSDRGYMLNETAVRKLVSQKENPEKTRVEFVANTLRKRGLINEDQTKSYLEMEPQQALKALEKLFLEHSKLRERAIISERLPVPGERLDTFIKERMQAAGYNIDNLKVRFLERSEYANQAAFSGNDRTSPFISTYYHHGGHDGEELAMIRSGVTNATDTTYTGDLKYWHNQARNPNYAVLVYAADALEPIGPAGYPKSNGFHTFLFDYYQIKRDSLLAIFER